MRAPQPHSDEALDGVIEIYNSQVTPRKQRTEIHWRVDWNLCREATTVNQSNGVHKIVFYLKDDHGFWNKVLLSFKW